MPYSYLHCGFADDNNAKIPKMARNTATFNLWWVYLFRSQIKNRGSFSTASAKTIDFYLTVTFTVL
jgi:hypothetical protein